MTEDFYEDWKNEVIAWNVGLNIDEQIARLEAGEDPNKVEKGTRRSLGLDISRSAYEKELEAIEDNIERGGIIEKCISCNSKNTKYDVGFWICNECNEVWDPLRLRFKGI